MPVAHIFTAEGWLTPARKKLMIKKVTDAIVEAESLPGVRDLTYVLIHDVADGGWGFAGTQRLRAGYQALAPRDPEDGAPACDGTLCAT
jgi:phenylpyruvate tautomerase PptA (4-oxalocrotonate tautomerase family)